MSDIGVKFYMEAIPDAKASKEAGRPIYRDAEMVEVLIPGDRNFRPVFPAHELAEQPTHEKPRGVTWAEKYSEAYAEFKAGATRSLFGTPLEEAPFLTRARVAELKALHIETVEQLASMTDRHKSRLGPGATALVEQAQAYLDAAAQTATPVALAEENAALKERMAQMEAMLADMAKTRGPGRPRKDEAA